MCGTTLTRPACCTPPTCRWVGPLGPSPSPGSPPLFSFAPTGQGTGGSQAQVVPPPPTPPLRVPRPGGLQSPPVPETWGHPERGQPPGRVSRSRTARRRAPSRAARPRAADVPRVIHYGLLYSVEHAFGKWTWDKHWFNGFNVSQCPPWDLSVDRPVAGVFPPPPLPGELKKEVSPRQGRRDRVRPLRPDSPTSGGTHGICRAPLIPWNLGPRWRWRAGSRWGSRPVCCVGVHRSKHRCAPPLSCAVNSGLLPRSHRHRDGSHAQCGILRVSQGPLPCQPAAGGGLRQGQPGIPAD